MKTLFLLVFASLSYASSGFSQEGSNATEQVLFESELASIYTEYVECIDEANGISKAYLLINAKNKSNSPIAVSFKKDLWFDGNCVSCDSESAEYRINIQLASGETKTGSCETSDGMRIFVRMLNLEHVRQLSHFELENIEVTKL